nr:hypothetical protein CoNPh37_CDS0200 [Staphylococcus phage S-CoN_Ph37]
MTCHLSHILLACLLLALVLFATFCMKIKCGTSPD